ncbi:AAA family ATPase [Nocardiopsis exhalans]|uniref:AAA family ATPase n=1 Tax=Nocardiopsis exhalans TaxID=163604 RepID=A0ABY5D4X8_9ACTN|nr:AAA family ATPase [Nocardiopsis exhalans]USY19427.1 AAA family ATPase [Nocardiopsis exhalans]
MYIERISVDGIRGFHGPRAVQDLEFPLPKDGQGSWTVLAGRNGSGKTTLLRAIALGLVGPSYARHLVPDFGHWVSHDAPTGDVTITIHPDNHWDKFTQGRRPQESFSGALHWRRVDTDRQLREQVSGPSNTSRGKGSKSPDRGPWSEETSGWYVAGYGPFRRLEGGSTAAQRLTLNNGPVARLASLFDEDVSLAESVQWLKDLLLRQKGGSLPEAPLDFVFRILNDGLLPDGFQVSHVDADGLWVKHSGKTSALREVSDGYRTVAALVLDLVRQLHWAGGEEVFAEDDGNRPVVVMPGVVLIDEIDVHLHVSWQKAIGGWLKKHFPNIQFIVSSHSPYICQSADPGGLIRLPGVNEEEAPRVVSEDLYQRIVYGSGDDALLTELFGIDSPYSDRANEKRELLSELESRVLTGEATERDEKEYVALRRALTSSPITRVREIASQFEAE